MPSPGVPRRRVRMVVHTGEADQREGDYYGAAVNRCARLRAIARGGQTLLSQATYALVHDAFLAGVLVRDLGRHRLSGREYRAILFTRFAIRRDVTESAA
jgi:class 3 adenylate cyclase